MWDKGLAMTRHSTPTGFSKLHNSMFICVYMFPMYLLRFRLPRPFSLRSVTCLLSAAPYISSDLYLYRYYAKMTDILRAHNHGSLFRSSVSTAVNQNPSRSHYPQLNTWGPSTNRLMLIGQPNTWTHRHTHTWSYKPVRWDMNLPVAVCMMF